MRRIADILSREDGVSIVFACLLMMVLFILGGIIIAYGYSNLDRATSDMTQARDYQTVSSAAQFVHAKMNTAAVTKSGTLYTVSGSTPQWVADTLNGKTVTVTDPSGTFATTTVTATTTASGVFTVSCTQGTTSGITLKFAVTLSASGSGYTLSCGTFAKEGA